MRFTKLFLAVLATAVALAGCQPAAEEAAEPEVTAEEAAAEEVMTDEQMLAAQTGVFAEAWARGDAAAIARMFTEGADIVGPDGERQHGREAIQARYAELFEGMYQGTTIDITQTSVKFPSSDTVIANGTYEIVGLQSGDGEEMTVKGLYLNVAVKESGEWKIHCNRPMIPIPPPPAS